ncbi:LysR family transcriptional regulator [Mycobacterium sp. BMJ-28]
MRQLTYAVAVADAGSFTAAARRCHVSQSALSTQVAQLENELGTRLFARTTRQVSLTEAGRLFIPAARRLLVDTAGLRELVADHLAVAQGTLRVGATQTATRVLDLPAVLAQVRRRQPAVRITITAGPSSELIDAVLAGTVDVALTSRLPGPPHGGVVFRALAPPEPVVAIVPSSRLTVGQQSISLAELAASGPFVEFAAGSQLRTLTDNAFREAGLHRDIIFELGHIDDIARTAIAGLGCALVPRIFTRGLKSGEADVLRLSDPVPSLTVGAYTRTNDPGPLIRTALDLFGAAARKHRG